MQRVTLLVLMTMLETTSAQTTCPGTCVALQISSGECSTLPNYRITDSSRCSAAATELGLSDTTVSTENDGNYPAGCYFSYNSNSLWLNNHGTGVASTSTYQGICETQPSSPPPPAAPPNPPGYLVVAGGYYQRGAPCQSVSERLSSTSECTAAAVALGLSDQTATSENTGSYPIGCCQSLRHEARNLMRLKLLCSPARHMTAHKH